KELNLSDEALEASMEAVRRVGEFAQRLAGAENGPAALAQLAAAAETEFRSALYDDLNAPEALAALFTFIKGANRELDRGGGDRTSLDRARAAFATMDGVLDIVPATEAVDAAFAREIEDLLARRKSARERRDFAEAD